MTWAYFTFDMSYSEPLDMRYCIPEMSLWTTWDRWACELLDVSKRKHDVGIYEIQYK